MAVSFEEIMIKLKTIGKWVFRLFPICAIALFAFGIVCGYLSKPQRAKAFVSHCANVFLNNPSLEALRNLPEEERPDLISIRQFDNGEWIAARIEHSCCVGAGFDAIVYFDSKQTIQFCDDYTFCGIGELSHKMSETKATNLSEFYGKLNYLNLKKWQQKKKEECHGKFDTGK